MPFTEFKDAGQVVASYGLNARSDGLFNKAALKAPSESLAEQIEFALSRKKATSSEMFAREALIAPMLFEVLREFALLDVWSSELRIRIDDALTGCPDHVISALPAPKAIYISDPRPLLAVAEAKRDDFTGGWGQCLAEMVACQRLNGDPETPVWGIVTTGESWQFGKLTGASFIQHNQSADLDPLEKLLGILHYIFAECQAVAERWAAEANGNSDLTKENSD